MHPQLHAASTTFPTCTSPAAATQLSSAQHSLSLSLSLSRPNTARTCSACGSPMVRHMLSPPGHTLLGPMYSRVSGSRERSIRPVMMRERIYMGSERRERDDRAPAKRRVRDKQDDGSATPTGAGAVCFWPARFCTAQRVANHTACSNTRQHVAQNNYRKPHPPPAAMTRSRSAALSSTLWLPLRQITCRIAEEEN